MGGIAFRAPVLATLFLIVAMANLAIPGSSNFVGEFFILLGAFRETIVIAILASPGVVLAAVYTLRLYVGAMHNRVGEQVDSRELSRGDALVLVPLVAVILAFAVYPQVALERSERDARQAIIPAQAALGERDGVLAGVTP
jgi:NADH-quinone oxidoreductase subunit M